MMILSPPVSLDPMAVLVTGLAIVAIVMDLRMDRPWPVWAKRLTIGVVVALVLAQGIHAAEIYDYNLCLTNQWGPWTWEYWFFNCWMY